jgi:O-antigen ligase
VSGSTFEASAGAAAGLRDRGKLEPALLRVATAATLLLPVPLFWSRAAADAALTAIAALFLLRCWLAADGSPFRTGWFRVAVALWIWLVAVSVQAGSLSSVEQAFVLIRLIVFALALDHWVLPPAPARRWLFRVFAALAALMIVECWQQYLTGVNLAGYPRWGDGALTGPFGTPRAGSAYIALFFPALLPVVTTGLARRDAWARVSAIALLVLGVATMLLIGQRMPALLMLLGLLATGLLLRQFRLPVLLALLVGALVVAATPVISPPTFQKLVLHFAEQMRHFPTSNYGVLYVRALVILEAHPWLGLGADGFRHGCADPRYFHGIPWLGVGDADQGGLLGCNLHPHNYYLELATDGGVPGLILFVALVAAWFRRLARPLGSGAGTSVALFVSALVQLWPLASTTALFVLPTAGWVFLTLGWGLADERASSIATSTHFSNKSQR